MSYRHFLGMKSLVCAAVISLPCMAETDVGPQRIINVNAASTRTEGQFQLTQNSATPTLAVPKQDVDFDNTTSYSVGGGVESYQARFMLEYYYTQADVDALNLATGTVAAEQKSQALYYSGYWVPDILYGVKGILGLGVGYAEQKFNVPQYSQIKDEGLTYKFSAGLEYGLIKHLSIYAAVEQIYFKDQEDTVTASSDEAVAFVTNNEQTRYAIGVNFRF